MEVGNNNVAQSGKLQVQLAQDPLIPPPANGVLGRSLEQYKCRVGTPTFCDSPRLVSFLKQQWL